MPEAAAATILSLDVEQKGTLAIVRCQGKLVAGVADMLYARVTSSSPAATDRARPYRPDAHGQHGPGRRRAALRLRQIHRLLP